VRRVSHPRVPLDQLVGELLLFLLTPLLPTFWVEYVYLQISGDKKIPSRVHIALLLLNAANCFMVIATQFTGWYYAIDAANVYHRGRSSLSPT
jgi:ACR3 family arsenite efflux pump ArsB